MTQKIQDTNARVSRGGRLREYWAERGVEQKRSKAVEWDHKDIDIEALLYEYSLKGFEFGRYVNNEDRYDFVLAAKRSLHDLAWLMKSDNLGVNGKIGIAFGARGGGGFASAHFEPEYNMINLTKPKGAGTMAHEYGHALDFNIGGLVDQNKNYWALSGGRSMSRWLDNNTGGTCRLLMRQLISEIKATDSFARLKDASDYWLYNTEVFARYFEQWCCYKLRQAHQSDSFLTHSWAEYIHTAEYLTEADFKKVLPTGDKLMKNIGLVLNGKPTEAYKPLPKPEKAKAKKLEPKKEPVKKAATPKKPAAKKTDPFSGMKTLPEKISERYHAGEITMRQAAEEFHKAGYDTHVDLEATRKRIGVRQASKKLYEKATGKTVQKPAPKKVAPKAVVAKAAVKKAKAVKPAPAKLAYQDYDKAFKALAKFTKKDMLRPMYGGVYHDNGDMAATDAYALAVVHKAQYPKDKEGKILSAKDRQAISGRYPNWKAVITPVNRSDGGTMINVADELEKVKKHLEKQKKTVAEYKKKGGDYADYGLRIYFGKKEFLPYQFKKVYYKPEQIEKILTFMKAAGPETRFYLDKEDPKKRAGVFRSGNLEALLMPLNIEN